jgi:hypothetical protein
MGSLSLKGNEGNGPRTGQGKRAVGDAAGHAGCRDLTRSEALGSGAGLGVDFVDVGLARSDLHDLKPGVRD